jgi:hypothetical protein
MLTIDAARLEAMVLAALPSDRMASEEEVAAVVDRLSNAFSATPEMREAVLKSVQAQKAIRMDTGIAIVGPGEHKPWVNGRKSSMDPFFWTRFERFLVQQRFPKGVLSGLHKTTDEVLDLLGNPAEPRSWKRRGLVLGEVQSGKTATYTSLICKAADAGYQLVILLTGTLENLRRQTQERVDEGFVGFDSSEQLKKNRRTRHVGVGLIDMRRNATVFTSSVADFNVTTATQLGLSLKALREPAIVVLKKNAKILGNFQNWVKDYNIGSDGSTDVPTLLIDDEADNASVNTRSDTNPTAVNAAIRALLKLFRRSTYVGFTATPFANIFVDPDSSSAMLGDDLFPNDFIYALKSPTNYFGPTHLFLDDVASASHLRNIKDAELHFPHRHKSDRQLATLPESLHKAVAAYLLSNAVRDLRKEGATHRSMLINVSRFTAVQDQVEQLVFQDLEQIKNDVRNFSKLDEREALRSPRLGLLRQVWAEEYEASSEFSWGEIQKALVEAVLPVKTVAVNQRTGSRALNYKAHRDTGLRVIAVGGNSLSRGLTLEGLAVSYFHRNSQMYDTLLQMGRWFGYRFGYEDLCRIWLPPEAIDWYGHITEATDELRAEIEAMYKSNRTPADFGLKVLSHPDSLLVTARNKMRASKEIVRIISVSEQGFESVELPADEDDRRHNWEVLQKFVAEAEASAKNRRVRGPQNRMYFCVPKEAVAGLLKGFIVPDTELRFQPSEIADLLDRIEDPILGEWDVVIPEGRSDREEKLGVDSVALQVRQLEYEPKRRIVVSGNKRRVGSRGIEKEGLSSEQVQAAEKEARIAAQKRAEEANEPAPEVLSVSDRFYRKVRTRPLLLLHLMDGTYEDREGQVHRLPKAPPLVAIGLSFPKFEDSSERKQVRYRANLVKLRELFDEEVDDDVDVEESANA